MGGVDPKKFVWSWKMGRLPLSAYNIKFDGDERLQTEAAKTGKFFLEISLGNVI